MIPFASIQREVGSNIEKFVQELGATFTSMIWVRRERMLINIKYGTCDLGLKVLCPIVNIESEPTAIPFEPPRYSVTVSLPSVVTRRHTDVSIS